MHKFRIKVQTVMGLDGRWHKIYIPQKRVLLFFWADIRNDDDGSYVAYESRKTAQEFLGFYSA